MVVTTGQSEVTRVVDKSEFIYSRFFAIKVVKALPALAFQI